MFELFIKAGNILKYRGLLFSRIRNKDRSTVRLCRNCNVSAWILLSRILTSKCQQDEFCSSVEQYFHWIFMMISTASYALGISTRGREHKLCEWNTNCLDTCLLNSPKSFGICVKHKAHGTHPVPGLVSFSPYELGNNNMVTARSTLLLNIFTLSRINTTSVA